MDCANSICKPSFPLRSRYPARAHTGRLAVLLVDNAPMVQARKSADSPRESLGVICRSQNRAFPETQTSRSKVSGLDIVSRRRRRAAAAGPAGVEELPARSVHALVGVSTEIVALSL